MAKFRNSDLSVLITTFNSSKQLRWVLSSLSWQTVRPREIIVADDGSDPETLEIIEEYRVTLGNTLIYSWQPNFGFRLSRSRNLAASRAHGSWLVFLDGDCVMPPDFLEIQLDLAQSSHLIFGSRKLLSKSQTERVLLEAPNLGSVSFLFSGRKFWKLPLGIMRTFPSRNWRQPRGFFMALEASLFKAIAGFDEAFQSWGLEDSDFVVRATRAGAILKDGRYATSLLHLFHREECRSSVSGNEIKFKSVLDSRATRASRSLWLEGED